MQASHNQGRFYPIPDSMRVLSGSFLKTVAIVTMLIDHIGAGIVLNMLSQGHYPFGMSWDASYIFYRALRLIGRTAFPIFCFLLVEGLMHTHNKFHYLLRMAVFSLLSEFSFDLALAADNETANTLNIVAIYETNATVIRSQQNVYFTLTIGLAVIMCMDFVFAKVKKILDGAARKKGAGNGAVSLPLTVLLYLMAATLSFAVLYAGCISANVLSTDYKWKGVMLIAFLYLLRRTQVLSSAFGYIFFSRFESSEIWAFPAFIMMMLYNEKRGYIKSNVLKYAFYAFYPVHLLFIYVLRTIIM